MSKENNNNNEETFLSASPKALHSGPSGGCRTPGLRPDPNGDRFLRRLGVTALAPGSSRRLDEGVLGSFSPSPCRCAS